MSKNTKALFKVLDVILIFMMAFGSPMSALAEPSPTGATIASDQADYPPGATVTLFGAGWAAEEAVQLFVNDDSFQSWSHSAEVTAAGDGTFTYQFELPTWFVANYSVTASGSTSGTATTTFTDLAIGTYDQCSNDDGDGYASGNTGCRWINGNLQGNNSTYNEGDATVQRLWLTDLIPGSTHTVTFKYGTTKSGKHAYDFLTRWDWSENWITVADRCEGITGCDTATDTYTAIPVDPNAAGFDASADLIQPRQFTMRGGTLNGATVPVIFSGDYTGDSETVITVSYTVGPSNGSMCQVKQGVTTCDVAIWFGAHVAMTAQWTAYNGTTGASTISGSPYHVALDAVDGAAVGQRDNQMQSGAVPVNGTIVIVKDAVPDDAQDFSFNITNGSTFDQDFTLDDDGGADNTYPNSMSFSLPEGTYTASEFNIPGGWDLTDLSCEVAGSNGSTYSVDLAGGQATINLFTSFASGDTVTCTFTDSKIVNQDLTVTKTATPSLGRTYHWLIDKSVDQTEVNIADGDTAEFNYTVEVTPDGYTDTGWAVNGQITVSNPNAFDISGVDVTDTIDNGGTCTVTNGTNVTVPANDSVVLNYSCSYASAPSPLNGTNTATATWDKDAYYTPNGSANNTASADFNSASLTETNRVITVVDDKTDPLNPVELGTSDYFNGPFTFEYSLDKEGVAGTCTDYTNTAVIEETGQEAEETVTVCVGLDLTVSKTASGTFDREYFWSITKNADATEVSIAEGGSYTFHYTVDVSQTGISDSGWTLNGVITITNPNNWQAITLTSLSDVVDNGGTCTVDAGPYVVPASGSLDVNYSCSYASNPSSYSGTNTATATWDKDTYHTPSGSDSGSAGFTLTQGGASNQTIHVTDSYAGDLGEVTASDSAPFASASFEYDREESGVAGTCTEYDNTATITETEQSADESVELCVGSDLIVTKTAAGSFDREYFWEIFKNADATEVSIAEGGDYTFHYTVEVNQTGFSDSGFEVHGVITVSNSNDWQSVTLTSLTDVVDNGGTCTVDAGPYEVPASGSINVNYSCSFAADPSSYSGTNTATATWNAATYFTPSGSDSGSANFTLSQDGATNQTVYVTDSYAGPLGSVDATDSAPFASASFEYDREESGVAGTCTEYDNTATITETGQSADETVELCVGKDLTVTKTAETSFTRTFTWDIDKSVDKTKVILEGTDPQSATFNYTVAVSHDSGTDSAWLVTGKITVTNPNDWQDIDANVSDLVNVGGGAVCTVEGEAVKTVSVPASDSVVLDYSCTFSSKPSYTGLNTATATWDDTLYHTPNGSTTGTAAVNFTTPTTIVDGSVTVVDDKTDPLNPVTLGNASYTQDNPIEFKYSLTKSGISGACTDYTNTATFTTNTTETTDSDSETVTVCSSNVTVLKLTGVGNTEPAVDPSMSWMFNLYDGPHGSDAPGSGSAWLSSSLASDNTSGDADGLLDFDFYSLNPSKTYTICEMTVPSGYTVEWKVDTDNDGTPDTVVLPYNPNAKDVTPEDLGTRCFDFGAGTSYPIPEGGTLAFQVINTFPGGEPRTPGYWKNWNRCTGGGQAANADRNGGRDKGFTLLEDILTNPGIIWDDILSDSFFVPITTCQQAVEILDQRVVTDNNKVGDGKKLASDGLRTLAMHLLAAQLNEGNGACTNQDVKDVILWSENLLDKYNFDGKKTTAYLTSKSADYAYALQLAKYLDAYNNSACDFTSLPTKPINKYP
jgi:hypothetical protein